MSDFWAALALVMVIEGLLPFAAPGLWRQALQQIASLDEAQMRLFGAISMGSGLALLYWVRG